MVTMDDISNAIILLVRVGAVARFVYCLGALDRSRGTGGAV